LSAALDPTTRLLRACRGEPVDRPPVWLMRQAGRYLPEYRELRAGIPFLDMCRDVSKAVEVSLQPVAAVGTEAVILFSDIFVPVAGMGVALDFAPGPVIADPIRRLAQVEALSLRDPRETVPYVFQILRQLRGELAAARLPLLGFAGAPFTLACYLVRGKGDPERRYEEVRALLRDEPEVARALLDRLAEMTLRYLEAQIEAGAQVVQLFDTWAGLLSEAEYREWALPGIRRVAAGLEGVEAPLILFASDAPHLVEVMAESGCDVLSIGARVEMADAARRVGRRVSLQGNLDPAELTLGREHIFARVRAIAAAAAPARGLILNLGHGITPDTPVDGVRAFVAAAKALAPGAGDVP
jgi:uroporphyrinogen decarboxylase